MPDCRDFQIFPIGLPSDTTSTPNRDICLVQLTGDRLDFQSIEVTSPGQSVGENVTWGVDDHFKIIKTCTFGDQIVVAFGNEDFLNKRKLGKTAHPFHFNLKGIRLIPESINGRLAFYAKQTGKKLAETTLDHLFPEDIAVFHFKSKTMLALSALKLSPNNTSKLTTSLLVYEGTRRGRANCSQIGAQREPATATRVEGAAAEVSPLFGGLGVSRLLRREHDAKDRALRGESVPQGKKKGGLRFEPAPNEQRKFVLSGQVHRVSKGGRDGNQRNTCWSRICSD